MIKAGTIVRLIRGGSSAGRGGFTAEYYAHTVQHEFVPFRSYATTVSYERSTGFIERVQRKGSVDSPYLAEMSPRNEPKRRVRVREVLERIYDDRQ